MLGDYGGGIDADVLTSSRTGNNGAQLATLRGKRLIIAGELEEGRRLSTAILKRITSTDTIRVEEKYHAPFDIVPSHSLVLFTNFLPRVGSTDRGTWRRILVVPFRAAFSEQKKITNYGQYLLEQAGGAVLAWAAEGARNYARNGFKLDIPEAVAEATEEYRARENWVANFIDAWCIREANARTGAHDLYLFYRDWAEACGEYVHSEREFSAAMGGAGFNQITPGNKRTWVGVKPDMARKYAG